MWAKATLRRSRNSCGKLSGRIRNQCLRNRTPTVWSGVHGAGFRLGALAIIGLAAGIAGTKLFRWETGPRTKSARWWVAGAGEPGGIVHFGFRLVSPGDIDTAVDEAERAGGKLLRRGEFSPGYPYAYIADPDGYEVEIWYE